MKKQSNLNYSWELFPEQYFMLQWFVIDELANNLYLISKGHRRLVTCVSTHYKWLKKIVDFLSWINK